MCYQDNRMGQSVDAFIIYSIWLTEFFCHFTDNAKEVQDQKQVIVVTARVHPGESQASWMMKGLIDYITGPDPGAKELRDVFIFKVVPMLNPDGVIVGNYRCSLAARDLNRNYRHPRKESFPTVWHVKSMMDKVLERHNVSEEKIYILSYGYTCIYGSVNSKVSTKCLCIWVIPP